MASNRSRGSVRNGPPEAVSQMVFTSACAPTRKHWWTALCSLSIAGWARCAGGRRGEDLTGGHHALLVGQATGLPARMAACVASRPATPTMAETTKSASGKVEQATVPSVPYTTRMPVTPAWRKREERLEANASVAARQQGRQRTAWAKASSTLRQRPGQQPEALRKLLDDGEVLFRLSR